jgi:hypothetical protein
VSPRTELKVDYARSRTAIRIVADFSEHWEFRNKTFGYVSARIKVPYKAGADFWVHLNLIAQPATHHENASAPPGLVHNEDDGECHYEIADRKIIVIVPLDRPELWGRTKESNKPLIYVDRSMATHSLCKWQDGIWLDLRVWITSEADRVPVPVRFEKGDSATVSGGQFESNRRKH